MIFDRLASLFQIKKPHRAQIFPQGAFTRCILHGRVPCQSVDHLTIRAIPQKLDYLGKQCLLWIFIVLTPVLRDFFHEEREDFLQNIVNGSVNSCNFQTTVEVPFQQRHVQQDLLG